MSSMGNMGSMISLVLAGVFFVGIHVGISGTSLRARLVERWGEMRYRGFFAALSAVGLTWLIVAFLHARTPVPTWLMGWRGLAALLNFFAVLMISFGVIGLSPTAIGGESKLGEPRAMHRVTRHPMLWGFAVWAATHMLFNPELPALCFFGAFLALALLGPRSIDKKRAALGEPWERYLAVTSNVPFAAIIQGRNRLELQEFVALPLFVAAVVTELLILFHGDLFGLPAW